MKCCNPIEVLLYRHPLKDEREKLEVQKDTFLKIYKELELDLPIEHYIFLDGDEIVKDLSQLPKNDYINIRCVLQGGGGDFQREGTGLKIGGAALVVAGVLLTVLSAGALAPVGVSLITTGIMTFGSGVYLYNYELETDSYSTIDQSKNTPSIKGSKNSDNSGGRVPVLLGRHLVTPFIAAKYYTSNLEQTGQGLSSSTQYQYLHLLLCSGYASMSVDTNTIQFGDVPITSYSDVSYDILESSTQNAYFPARVVQDTVNSQLKRPVGGIGATDTAVTRTTSTNTKSAKVTLLFSNGLYFVRDDGGVGSNGVGFFLEWKNVGDPDSSYQVFGANYSYGGSSWTRIAGTMNYTCRATYSVTFSDTNPDRQYTIRVRRRESGTVSTQSVETCYWEDLKSYTKDTSGNTDPIESTTKANLNVTSFKVRATNQLSGVIDDVNYEATAYARVYSGTGTGPAQWSSALTSNPASAFLKVLTDPLINKNPILSADEANRIDFESLEEWYTFCNTKGFECNVYEVGDTTVQSVLNNICSVGRATWTMIDNKYTILIDTYKTDIIQYFTPRNTYDFSASKAFYEAPTCFKIAFIDKDSGYVEASRYVYYDTYDGLPRSTDIVEDVNMYGAMDADQVWKLGKYMHAVTRLRPETYTFSADIEYIMCTRGDRIKLNHDVPLFGLSSGRIISPIESGGNTQGFISDEILQFEVGKSYAVTIRLDDGTSITKNLTNPGIDTSSILFETPITGAGIIFEDDLFMFGEQGSIDVDLIVEKIEPNENLGANITCIEYNEDIYTADSGTIPVYDPKISKGGSSYLSVGSLPEDQEDKVSQNQQIITLTDQITYALSAAYPDSFQSTTAMGWHPSSYDDFNYIYVNYDDGNKIYKKTLLGDENGGALNTASSKYPTLLGDYIYYINVDAGGALYQKGKDVVNNGSEFANNEMYKFVIDPEAEDIYYINANDNYYIYKIPQGTSGNGSVFLSTTVRDLGISGSTLFYTKQSDSYIYYVDISDTGTEATFYSVGAVQEFIVSQTGYLFYLKNEDFILYRKSTTDLGTETVEGEPTYGVTTGFGVTHNGDVIFSSPVNLGYLFIGLTTSSIQNATLESTATVFALTGSITTGSTVITGVSADDLDQVVVKDRLVGNGIPDSTYIQMKGNDFIYMTNAATATLGSTSINVYGSRITLNANRVIIPGTVTAELLEASAINSKAKTTSGFYKSEFDLDAGTIQLRKDDDTTVFDFDPDRTGSELVLSGDLQIDADDAGRYLRLGSEGLYVEDNSSNIVHDLPDAALVSGFTYSGHLIYTDPTIASTKIYDTSSAAVDTWTDIVCQEYGNTNVKSVLLSVAIQCNPDPAPGYRIIRATVYFRPKGTNWQYGFSAGTPAVSNVMTYAPFTSGDIMGGTGLIVVPIGTDTSIQYRVLSSVTPANDVFPLTVSQLGLFV